MSKLLHEALLDAMAAKNLSALDVAFYSKTSIAGINRMLRNEHINPRIETLLCLAIALEVPIGELAEAAARSIQAEHKSVDTLTVSDDNTPAGEQL